MKKPLFIPLLLLLVSSAAAAPEVIVKDDFENQSAGQQLDALQNWKYIAGWIKPEYGKIVAEGKNQFLRMKGDLFARNQVLLKDKLTCRFKVRATGEDGEIGGFTFRSVEAKVRYDILLSYKYANIVLAVDHAGTRTKLAGENGVQKKVFQEVIVTVEKEDGGVKFNVSLDGNNLLESQDHSENAAIFTTGFTAGFFTYNDKMIDIDSVEFTQGK